MSNRHARGLMAALLLLTLVPSGVLGHAELDTISPADKSSGPSPTEIVGTFVQNLDPTKSSFTVVDSTGKVVAQGGQVASDDVRKMTLPLTAPLAPGAYVIRWVTVSTEDGELARGTTTFTVVAATPSPSLAPSASASPSTVPSEAASPSVEPSALASPAPSPSGSGGTPTSTSDAVIPVIGALIVLAALGLWLLRSRSRRVG
jgi:methionine-rich copper-binding protein CopC